MAPAADQCGACGTTTPTGARYCPSCGHRLDTLVVDLAPPRPPDGAADAAPSVVRRLGVVAGVLALLGALGFVLLADGGDSGDEDGTPESRAALTPIPVPTEDPATAPATPRPTRPPTPTPSPRAFEPAPMVEPGSLPRLASSHLVVVETAFVHFLDLTTGEWASQELGRQARGVDQMRQVGDSMAIAIQGAVVIAHPDNGVNPVQTGSSFWVVGIGGDVIAIQDWNREEPAIVGYGEDASVVWEQGEDRPAWVMGFAATGELVVQYGSTVAAVTPGGGAREIARGIGGGLLAGEWLVVWDCVDVDDCGTDLVSLDSGLRLAVPAPDAFAEGNVLYTNLSPTDQGGPVPYVVHDSTLHRLDATVADGLTEPATIAIDDAGYIAQGRGGDVTLWSLDGESWTIESPGGTPRGVGFMTIPTNG